MIRSPISCASAIPGSRKPISHARAPRASETRAISAIHSTVPWPDLDRSHAPEATSGSETTDRQTSQKPHGTAPKRVLGSRRVRRAGKERRETPGHALLGDGGGDRRRGRLHHSELPARRREVLL